MRLPSSLAMWTAFLITGCIGLSNSADARETRPEAWPLPENIPAAAPDAYTRSDTIRFGYYELISGEPHAIEGETWTFDHGAPDPLEGWTSMNWGNSRGKPFRRITAADWDGHGNPVAAPIVGGLASLWVGAYQDEAEELCWESGLGYGNSWCTQARTPILEWDGSDPVDLSFRFFSNSESGFDYARVKLLMVDQYFELPIGSAEFTGLHGDPSTGSYLLHTEQLTDADFWDGHTRFQLIFEFQSDGGWSDEDGAYTTDFGGFAFDDVTISNNLVGGDVAYDFESGLGDIVITECLELPSLLGVAPLSNYTILDPCSCELSGNVIELHNDAGQHYDGQRELVLSPIVDRGALPESYNTWIAEWDEYQESPRSNGVFFRPRWVYYPYICPFTGSSTWSEPLGQGTFYYTGSDPICYRNRNVASDWGVPGGGTAYRFIYELYASCDVFGIPPEDCTYSNFTPLLDNLQVMATASPLAPGISFEVGATFIDGWGQQGTLAPTDGGNADIVFDLHFTGSEPDRLGDSLVVKGPLPTASTKWEARFWWRVRHEGPSAGAIPGYNGWKTAVADGRNIVGANGEFTYGLMDSVQVGSSVAKNKFISEFREDDDDFAGENLPTNEMIWDGILAPGTQIEYFVSANYVATPNAMFLLPDTTGGYHREFEILPRYRLDGGVAKFPTLLYVNAQSGDAETFIEAALNGVLTGALPTDPIPVPTPWDRYDHDGSCSCFNAPMLRSPGGNNGLTLQQLLQYRAILVNTGSGNSALEIEDLRGISDWLSATQCAGNSNRQALLMNGDQIAADVSSTYPSLLHNQLGGRLVCNQYSASGCGPTPADLSRCLRIEDAATPLYPSVLGTDYNYDAWGNGCPETFTFNVIGTGNGGVGNRVYHDHDDTGATTNFAQVARSATTPALGNYRSVIDGVSWHHLSDRDLTEECRSDFEHIVTAARREIEAALVWAFDGTLPGLSSGTGCSTVDAPEDGVLEGAGTAFLGIEPNPSRGATTVRFQLAATGRVELAVFDVAGRRVRALVDETLTPGPHRTSWDGRDDVGRALPAGVYWAELRTEFDAPRQKLLILK